MKKFFVIVAAFCFVLPTAYPQARFVSHDYEQYFQWFHDQSQVANLYTDGAELFTFSKGNLKSSPCQESETLTQLPVGLKLTNIVDELEGFPEDEINGYYDHWYHVMGTDTHGNSFEGFIWGANIAKSWQISDYTGDGNNEFVMLGIASKQRKDMKDINAEIKILKSGKIISRAMVPGLCVFEECASSALIRILKDKPCKGIVIVEVSTMTIGCAAGIEKAYFFRTPSGDLDRVYHAELTTQKQYRNTSFEFVDENGAKVLCKFSHEDDNYSPVWDAKVIQPKTKSIAKVTSKKARA
jgi:hypothetical protein